MKRPDPKQAIHIVTKLDFPDHKNTRLSFGEYIADVLFDSKSGVGHWIVQQVGSAEIVHWAQEPTFDDALRCAQEFLEKRMRQSLGICD